MHVDTQLKGFNNYMNGKFFQKKMRKAVPLGGNLANPTLIVARFQFFYRATVIVRTQNVKLKNFWALYFLSDSYFTEAKKFEIYQLWSKNLSVADGNEILFRGRKRFQLNQE